MTVEFAPGARQDASDAIRRYLADAGAAVARGFEHEIAQILDLIERRPGIGTRGARDTRTVPLRRYPYSIHYRIAGPSIQVIAIAHHRRRPGYWSKRT